MSDTAQATGIADAAESFEALLAGEFPDNETPKGATKSNEAPADEAEAFEGEIEGDETAASSEEPDADSGDEPVAEEDGSEDSESEAQFVTVTINGKAEQVSLDEAVKGYQRQRDYSQKTAALAEERRALETNYQQVLEERSQYAQLLGALQQQLAQLQPQEPDWQRLYDTDPLEYVRQKDLWREKSEKMSAAQYEQQRLQAIQLQEQQAGIAQLVQQNRHKMVEMIPAWRDAQKWEADRTKLVDYGKKLGFSDQELGQAYDHRAIVALYKAMQYDNLVAKRPQAAPPRGPRTAPVGSASSAPKSTNEYSKAKQRLAGSGKVGDAAILMEGLLD
jgi:hypothetical protein